jgi:hypothetical protein
MSNNCQIKEFRAVEDTTEIYDVKPKELHSGYKDVTAIQNDNF